MWQMIAYHYAMEDGTYQYMEVWDKRTKRGWQRHVVRNGEETVYRCGAEEVLGALGDILRGRSEDIVELKIDGELVLVKR